MKIFFVAFAFLAIGFFLGKLAAPKQLLAGQQKFTLANCVATLDLAKARQGSRGWAFWFVKKELTGGLNVKMSQVGPQQAKHAAHKHEEAEVFYILQGKAQFTLDGDSVAVGPNSTLFCPPGVLHGIRNAGDDSLRYLVIKDN